MLFRFWNWKSATFSALIRCPIFFATTIKFGMSEALGAAVAEFALRFVASGFFGAATQAMRNLRPAWLATAFFVLVLPALGHAFEWLVHALRGTPNLKAGIIGSVIFTIVATLFNWYSMSRGAFVTGEGAQSIGKDLASIPRLIAGFIAFLPMLVWRQVVRTAR